MANHITGLDHVTIAVPDLEEAGKAFARLGFTLSPKGVHQEWGTANLCMMFGGDYIHLLAAVGEGAKADSVRAFVDQRGQGLYSIALASPHCPAAVEALRRAGLDARLPRALTRVLEDGTAVRFSESPLPPECTPGVTTSLVQPVTPDLMRRPEWLAHANGACGLASVSAIVEDPTALTHAWDKVFGPYTAVITDDTVTIHTGSGLIYLSRPDELSQLHPDVDEDELPPPPALIALSLKVADTNAAAAFLKANKVDFSRDSEGTVRIPDYECCGVNLELVRG